MSYLFLKGMSLCHIQLFISSSIIDFPTLIFSKTYFIVQFVFKYLSWFELLI